jgi:glycine cleavage system H protein
MRKENRMVLILCIITAIVILTIEILLKRDQKQIPAKSLSIKLKVAPEIVLQRFFHPGHMWALEQKAEVVAIGADDFAQKFIGTVESVQLPNAGSTVRQGEEIIALQHKDKILKQVAPISGVVIAVNKKLNRSPSLINDSPLEKGWIAKISPTDFAREKRNLLKGRTAERWQDAIRAELIHFFAPQRFALQDGGNIINNFCDNVSDEEWLRLQNEFFPSVYSVVPKQSTEQSVQATSLST